MTFMRKFLDSLNMNNWNGKSSKVNNPDNFSKGSENITPLTPQEMQSLITRYEAAERRNVPSSPSDSSHQISPTNNRQEDTPSYIKNTPAATNMNNTIDFQRIRQFWKLYPPKYKNNSLDATLEEYFLYGKVLMLNLFENGSSLRDTFPAYFEYECHLSNASKLQNQILNEGYLAPAPIHLVLKSYTVQELKIIADSIGCKKSGKKAELINRICQNMPTETINSVLQNEKIYVLSEIGEYFLHSNYDYVELHRHWNYNVPLHAFNQNRFLGNKKRSFNDNIYSLVSQRIYQNCVSHNYYMMDADFLTLYTIALSEHRYDIALNDYLHSLYLKSCCIHTVQYYSNDFYYYTDNINDIIVFTTHSAAPLVELQQFYTPAFVENVYADLSLPPSFMTLGETIEMVNEMISSTIFDYDKYNHLLSMRIKQYAMLNSK